MNSQEFLANIRANSPRPENRKPGYSQRLDQLHLEYLLEKILLNLLLIRQALDTKR